MRRALIALTVVTLAACSPTVSPGDATPNDGPPNSDSTRSDAADSGPSVSGPDVPASMDVAVDAARETGAADAIDSATTADAPDVTSILDASAEVADSPVDDSAAMSDAAAPDGADDGGTVTAEAGAPDAVDAGPSVPCTMAQQTDCVPCMGNMNNLCSPTEALIVQYDINRGENPNDPVNGCYACLWVAGCIDDTMYASDVNHECGDLPSGTFTAGNGSTGAYTPLCLDTLGCILTSGCANGITETNCYCGPAGGTPTPCAANGPITNGLCKTAETDGLMALPDNGTAVEIQWTDITQPSGLANQIFVCGLANSCTACPDNN